MLHLILVINTCHSKDMMPTTLYICSMCAHMYVAIMMDVEIMDVDRNTHIKAYGEWRKRTSCHNCMKICIHVLTYYVYVCV